MKKYQNTYLTRDPTIFFILGVKPCFCFLPAAMLLPATPAAAEPAAVRCGVLLLFVVASSKGVFAEMVDLVKLILSWSFRF